MRVLHWCMLGVTVLLLVCEVTISQLCNSLIILVDGFHTLFILMRMAITPPPQTASRIKPPVSAPDSTVSPPHTSSSTSSATRALPAAPSTLLDPPPPALSCGLSYSGCRIPTVGGFISALLLASLCLSYIMEIVGFSMQPQPARRPLLLVVVSVASLVHKMLVLWLDLDQQQTPETICHLEVNRQVFTEEEVKGRAEPGRVLYDVSQVQSAVDDSFHNGALVLCNPGTSSVPDSDPQTPEGAEVHLPASAPRFSREGEVMSGVADLCQTKDVPETSRDEISMGSLGTSPGCSPSQHNERPVPAHQPAFLPLLVLVVQGLSTSLLALINSLVMLLLTPQCLHTPGPCSLLVYLDPGLSLLAVVSLTATATPQVHRYGLLLLQATPPHICVSDLGRRIASVPGVQAVHDLHVWQLTETLTVASVHVHCCAGFPAHRCSDLMSGVTKVLQSVGVNCCTVQPEFASCSESPAGTSEASPVVHREDPCLPPLLACNLACGKACAGSMCCSPSEEESRTVPAPPAGETKEETLVIENTFL